MTTALLANRPKIFGPESNGALKVGGKIRTRVFEADQIYHTDLLPGFEVPLKRLFALADAWGDDQPE